MPDQAKNIYIFTLPYANIQIEHLQTCSYSQPERKSQNV